MWKDNLEHAGSVLSTDEIAEALGVRPDDIESYRTEGVEPTSEVQARLGFLKDTIQALGDMPDTQKATWLGQSHDELQSSTAFDRIRGGNGGEVVAVAEKAGQVYVASAAQETTF